jgi:DNA repair photolyase
MELLLSNSISIYISTKARIPNKFVELFARHPGLVFAQVGITTLDDHIRQALEPNAAPVKIRLSNINRLLSVGVFTEARMDPLIPSLTDQEESLSTLFQGLSAVGLKNAVASYLFLRQSNRAAIFYALRGLDRCIDDYYTDKIDNYCAGSSIQVVSRTYREGKYQFLGSLSNEYGISVKFCSCKNPGLTADMCHPYGQPIVQGKDQLGLF